MNSCDKALELLFKHPEKIDWDFLSRNSNSKALELLFKHPENIDWWYSLSMNSNPKALELLEKNQEKIEWHYLSQKPSIFYIPPKGARRT